MAQNPIVEKLRKQSTKEVTIKDEQFGDIKWTVRQLSTIEMAENADIFSELPSEPDLKGVDPKVTSQVQSKTVRTVLPMMKKILPMCSVSPRITINDDDPRLKEAESNTVHLNEIPIKLAFEIFNQILLISGLTKEAEDDRKKLQSPPSVSS